MKNLRNFIKKITIKIFLLIGITTPIFSSTTFSGFTGILAKMSSNPEKSDFESQMRMETFINGQIGITDNIFVRGEFSIKTDDILKEGITEETDAVFCMNELSATWSSSFYGKFQYITLFTGTVEPIGSDLFLQRYFGTSPFVSPLLESYRGLKAAYPYEIHGNGASYILKFDTMPIASGFYIYKNKDNVWDEQRLNIDFRFGTVFKYLSLDFDYGIETPLNINTQGEEALLVIDTLYTHTGFNILLGSKHFFSIFAQGGFKGLAVKGNDRDKTIESRDIFLVVEPRFTARRYQISIAAFSFPKDAVEKLMFIDDRDEQGAFTNCLGVNLTIHTDTLYIKNKNYTFGFHVTASFPDRDFMDLKNVKEYKEMFIDGDYNIKVTPFVGIPLASGTLKTMLQLKISDFKKETWKQAIELDIGYKSLL